MRYIVVNLRMLNAELCPDQVTTAHKIDVSADKLYRSIHKTGNCIIGQWFIQEVTEYKSGKGGKTSGSFKRGEIKAARQLLKQSNGYNSED